MNWKEQRRIERFKQRVKQQKHLCVCCWLHTCTACRRQDSRAVQSSHSDEDTRCEAPNWSRTATSAERKQASEGNWGDWLVPHSCWSYHKPKWPTRHWTETWRFIYTYQLHRVRRMQGVRWDQLSVSITHMFTWRARYFTAALDTKS